MSRLCANCNTDISRRHHAAKYCSDTCKSTLYRDQGMWTKNAAQYRKNNPARNMLWVAKQRAKRKGIPFTLTTELTIPEYCPVLDIPIGIQSQPGHPNSPSLDRINPELGYVDGNVRVISNRANTLKNNATLEEMRLILKDLEDIHGQ